MPATGPRVAVCIPAFRAVDTIAETIASVRAQTVADWECVVVDDGSGDATAAAARDAAGDDERIRVVEGANVGAAANWNRVVAATTAPYVKLLCSDDTLLPTCLERQAAILDADPSATLVMVAAQRRLVGPDGRVLRAAHGLNGIDRRATRLRGVDARRAVVRAGTNPFGEPSAVLIRREALAAVGGFDPTWRYMLDVGTYVALFDLGDVALVREPLATFRVSAGAWSGRLAAEQGAEARRLIRSVAATTPVRRGELAQGLARTRVLPTVRRIVTALGERRAR